VEGSERQDQAKVDLTDDDLAQIKGYVHTSPLEPNDARQTPAQAGVWKRNRLFRAVIRHPAILVAIVLEPGSLLKVVFAGIHC
jgi:hypothetical protein